MPLSLSNRDQNSGHLFYNRRLRAATTRFSVRMKHDDRKQTAALALSMVLVAIAAGWMMLLNVLKPTGIVGDSAIIGDRDSGALYARIDGRLYPALNLTSARLATGTAGQPTWVKPAEIAKYPTGPLVGIPGAPAAMPVNRGAVSAWAVCDTAGRPRSADKPVVTSIAGPITGGGRATHLRDDAGLLVTFDGSTYVIWGGKRSQIDPTNRAVTLSLGLDPGVTSPIQISRALFDGLPATEPLRVPAVPEAGTPSTWVPGARVGSVLQAQTAGGGSQFYVLLPDGVQKISSFVADLLRSANSYGAAAPRVVTPDVLVHTPQVTSLPVEYYPAGRLNFVDTAADPTTCVSWEKASTDPQARVAVYNGRGLPVPPSMDSRIVRLVRDDRAPASVVATQVLVLPGAANFVTSTSGVITAESRESLFWVPEESQQVVHAVDALRSNIIVVGAKQRGKTTTLMALMCSAATMYTPERVTFFCIGGATMAQIGSLPHVTDIVSPKDAEGIERILSTMDALIDAREEAFRRAKIDMDGFRERRFGIGGDGVGGTDPTDAFGDVFVVLDDYDDLYAKDTLLGDRIISLSSRGPEYGVHLMCSAGGWIHGQRQSLLQNVTARIQLRLADPGESQMGHLSIESREAARRTLNRPGFGLTESLHELRIGVPALADPGTGELVGITDVGARIADVAGVTKHASLQRLPQRVELSAIVEHEAVHQGGDDLSIAFAIGERHELGPVPIKLRESPGLMILGRQGCGKTTALVAIGEAVMNRFSPQQAQLTLIDPKTAPHGLRDLHAPGYVRAYAYDQDEIDEVITELAQQILLPRLPPKGLSQEELRALKPWEGPRHFVLIDDVQDLRPAQSYPQKPPVGAALWKLMERARQVGLHVFSTRNSANWATMPMDPRVKSQTSAKVAQLYMDNDPQNRINRSVRAQTLPPGRGLLVGADGDVEGILVGYPSVPGEQ